MSHLLLRSIGSAFVGVFQVVHRIAGQCSGLHCHLGSVVMNAHGSVSGGGFNLLRHVGGVQQLMRQGAGLGSGQMQR